MNDEEDQPEWVTLLRLVEHLHNSRDALPPADRCLMTEDVKIMMYRILLIKVLRDSKSLNERQYTPGGAGEKSVLSVLMYALYSDALESSRRGSSVLTMWMPLPDNEQKLLIRLIRLTQPTKSILHLSVPVTVR
jgi:hypothetical protein